METYFFYPELYDQLYNCSQFDYDGWSRFGTKNVPLGIASIVVGVVLQLVYFPIIVTICQEKFISNSCYKLMLFLGVMDCATLIASAFITGYLTIRGAVFCMYPNLIYFTGIGGFASWSSSCVACMLLTINRCLDIHFPQLGRRLFHGNRTWFWLLLPTAVYLRIIFFETTLTYNSSYLSWFFNPYYGMDLPNSYDTVYNSYLHLAVNMLTVVVLFVGNATLCYYVIRRSQIMDQENAFLFQRQFLLQVFVISVPFFSTALLYVYMQFLYSPLWLTFMASFTYIYNSGNAALTYLLLNPTLRKATVDTFLRRRPEAKTRHPSHFGGISNTLDNQGRRTYISPKNSVIPPTKSLMV